MTQQENFWQNYTWIDTTGEIVKQGHGGVAIVPKGYTQPALIVSEVSDKFVVNLYLETTGNYSGIYESALPAVWEVFGNRSKVE